MSGRDNIFVTPPSRGPATDEFCRQLAEMKAKNPGKSLRETIETDGIATYRAAVEEFYSIHSTDAPVPGVTIEKLTIKGPGEHELGLTVYRPKTAESDAPAMIYFPGGAGLVTLETAYDHPCSTMASTSHCVVIKVDCRLGPEFDRTHAIQDAIHATREIAATLSGTYKFANDKIIVAGNSSGAHLASMVASCSATEGLPVVGQILITPSVDLSGACRKNSEYTVQQDQDLMFPAADIEYLVGLSLPDGIDPKSPEISPCYREATSFPPTSIIVGQCDGLFGDAAEFDKKLSSAGVPCEMTVIPGQVHAAMLCYKTLPDGPYQAEIAGNALLGHKARLASSATVSPRK